jgi:prepilin peptidase CpaA
MTAHLLILGTLLAIAAASDVAQRRVPNLLVAPLAVAGLAAQWSSGGVLGAGNGLLAGGVVLVVLGIAWANGALGGGDVKLAAATATWLGLGSVVPFLLYAGAAGVPVALVTRLSYRFETWRLARVVGPGGALVAPLEGSRETAPVAVAVALGALAVLWGKP